MKYEIKATDGRATFCMRAGKDLVKSTMPLATAKKHLATAKEIKFNEGESFPIDVDDTYFFEGTCVSEEIVETETPAHPEKSEVKPNKFIKKGGKR